MNFSKYFKIKSRFIYAVSVVVLSAFLSTPQAQATDNFDPFQCTRKTVQLKDLELDVDKSLADQGNVDARNRLGSKLVNKGDYEGAISYFTLTVAQGSADGQSNLGVLYEKGWGVPRNLEKAAELYKLSADQGHTIAQNNLGCFYLMGKGVEKDLNAAFKYCKLSADKGHKMACRNVGVFYFMGTGVGKDNEEAFRYYRLAAIQGDAEALKGLIHFSNQGDQYAIHEVASLMFSGTVLPRDQKKAYQLFTKAANQGNANSQFILATILEGGITERQVEGHGCSNIATIVPKDESKAFQYYQLSANQGHPDALYHLGCIHSDGLFKITEGNCDCPGMGYCMRNHTITTIICGKNLEKARVCFQAAAVRGHEGAQKRL